MRSAAAYSGWAYAMAASAKVEGSAIVVLAANPRRPARSRPSEYPAGPALRTVSHACRNRALVTYPWVVLCVQSGCGHGVKSPEEAGHGPLCRVRPAVDGIRAACVSYGDLGGHRPRSGAVAAQTRVWDDPRPDTGESRRRGRFRPTSRADNHALAQVGTRQTDPRIQQDSRNSARVAHTC